MPNKAKPKIKIICQNCGILFPVYPSLAKKQKYCNIACANKGRIGNKNAKKKEGKMSKKQYENPKGVGLKDVAQRGDYSTRFSKYETRAGKDTAKRPVEDRKTCYHWLFERISFDTPIYQCRACKKKIRLPEKKNTPQL